MTTVSERTREARRLLYAQVPRLCSLEEVAPMSDEDTILTAVASGLMDEED